MSKTAFWLESSSLLVWLKLIMLPVAVWFIYYLINSDFITSTAYRVGFALIIVYLSFFIIERLTFWLAKLPADQYVIANFDNNTLHIALEQRADFPIDRLVAITFAENTFFMGIRWPQSKNIITVTTIDGVKELKTNFSYTPLITFIRQVDKLVKIKQEE
jgi:hypothetical protein